MNRRSHLHDATTTDESRMWPLDVSLVTVSALVLYLIITKLRFDDPRWLYNAWTYAVIVPLVALALAYTLRNVASQFVQKSVQLGFMFSICVHLLLLVMAIHVIIFSSLIPVTSKGKKKTRTPLRRTVPEHVFRTPQEQRQTPDWSRPAETQTASRVIPQEQRQMPPVQRTQPKLTMPKPREVQPRERQLEKMLMKRETFTPTKPMPSNSPSKLARREIDQQSPSPSVRPIDVPSPSTRSTESAEASPAERQISQQQRRRSSSSRAPEMPEMTSVAPSLTPRQMQRTPSAAARSRSEALPMVGESGARRQPRAQSRQSRTRPAGAAPTAPSIAITRESPQATRPLSPVDSPLTRSGRTPGAQISANNSAASAANMTGQASVGGAEYSRSDLAARAGMPNVRGGDATRTPGRSNRANPNPGFAPVGAPTAADAMAVSSTGTAGSGTADSATDRMGIEDLIRMENAAGRGGSRSPTLDGDGGPSMALDLMAPVGPVGLGDTFNPRPGTTTADDQPEVASMEISREDRPKRDAGGPVTPAGAEVAAVESFSRRVMRTKGGAMADSGGFAGEATEEAIELGLRYLASVQNSDGSWSLQGHGEEVVLRTDTAATGLCLLAFQGAGYTHKEHQHAETVAKALKFLTDNQRSSGNLYRSENPESDRNVAFYSHGIAALAMSEAYGMTQDEELREPAQSAIRYIVATQHRDRGGWRYTPQISSDTSVSGWMMMALKSGELAGLTVPASTYSGINHWLDLAQQNKDRPDRYRYNPYAPNTPQQRHGRIPSPTMTAVGMLMRMYSGWRRDNQAMQSAADYLLEHPPQVGTPTSPKRDAYYWYYATQVMFHMGGKHWETWNSYLNPMLLGDQIKTGSQAGSWDPRKPVPDMWAPHAGRLYVTTMNLLNLEVYYRHLPIYEDTAE